MHGYAHNRACQLSHHPKYVDGTGIEDFEVCERFFSLSNNCAGVTRYTTSFHRRQILDTHFRDSDDARRLAIGKFIYQNYVECSKRISRISETFKQLGAEDLVHDGTYARYYQEEKEALSTLATEPLEDQARFKYVAALERFWAARNQWEHEATKAGMFPGQLAAIHSPLPPKVQSALTEYNEASAIAEHLERILGLTCRWECSSSEFAEAVKWANERKYRLALDRLQRLVIQRLFELQKANLVSTGNPVH
jgi:hypothetical protein